jgi:hypothetical protein
MSRQGENRRGAAAQSRFRERAAIPFAPSAGVALRVAALGHVQQAALLVETARSRKSSIQTRAPDLRVFP